MQDEGTTTAPTSATPELAPCPPWCTLPANHDPFEETLDPEGRLHPGPGFDLVSVAMDDVNGWAAQVDQHAIDAWMGDHDTHVDAAELATRLEQLAADATRAAEWLRNQQG